MTEKILLVDVSSIFHRSYSILSKRMPHAKDKFDVPCAGTYGFFTTLFKAFKQFGPFSKYLFALDVKNSSGERKKIDSTYKKGRVKQKNDFYSDKENLISRYLELFGFVPLGLSGYEADDIIASACRYISEKNIETNYEIYILSGDSDLEMCTKYTKKIKFIKTQPKWALINYNDVLDKWGVKDPMDIALIKAISGDSSDNISGVYGYKRKKALKVYKNSDFLKKNREIIEKNLSLITLKDDLDCVPRGVNINSEKLTEIFDLLNSKALLKRVKEINKMF